MTPSMKAIKQLLVNAGCTFVIASEDDSETLDNMKIAIHGITTNIDLALERYRDISGMILDAETKHAVSEIKRLATELLALLKKVNYQSIPPAISRVILKYLANILGFTEQLHGTLEQRRLDIIKNLCKRCSDAARSIGDDHKRERRSLVGV